MICDLLWIDRSLRISYFGFFCCLFLTNQFFLPYNFFVSIVAPLALAPVSFKGSIAFGPSRVPIPVVSFENTWRTLSCARSRIFISFFVFGSSLLFSTSIAPEFSFEWFRVIASYLVAVCLFILVTARLFRDHEDFYGSFFTFFCIITGLNCVISIYLYFQSVPDVHTLMNSRFSPGFGRAPDHFPTTGALSFSVSLAAAAGLFLSERKIIRKTIAGICGAVFLLGLALTQSRGPLLGALLAIAISGWILLSGRFRFYFSLAMIFFILLFICFLPEAFGRIIERGGSHRFEVWRKFFDLSVDRFFAGYGERLMAAVQLDDGEVIGHAHNIFLSAFFRGGVVAFSGLVFSYFFSALNTFRAAATEKITIPLILLLDILIAGFFDFDQIIFLSDWQWPCFWLPLGIFIAVELNDIDGAHLTRFRRLDRHVTP